MANRTSLPEAVPAPRAALAVVTALTFDMLGMTTDAVGEVIAIARGELGITNTQASAFH